MACCALEGIPTFSPSANDPCLWIASLGDTGRTKTANIKLYLTGLRSYCVDLGTADLRRVPPVAHDQRLRPILPNPRHTQATATHPTGIQDRPLPSRHHTHHRCSRRQRLCRHRPLPSKPWPSIPRPPLGGIQAAESTTTRGRTQELLWSLLSLGRSHMGKQVGSPDEDIQLPGRWKSSAYKRYIETHPEHIFGISRRLQTSPSPGPLRARPTLSSPTPSDIPVTPASLGPVGGVLG